MLWKRAALGQDAQAVQVQYQHVLSANADMKAIPKKPLTNAELKKLDYPMPDDRQDAAPVDPSCASSTVPQTAQEHVESIACCNSTPKHHKLHLNMCQPGLTALHPQWGGKTWGGKNVSPQFTSSLLIHYQSVARRSQTAAFSHHHWTALKAHQGYTVWPWSCCPQPL
ncbi:MAG: hypothetical protein FRX49_11316 [Trebouxia sp. A1-2]|nr:MAG: hypothetical protein FRX49_11316 [Trebouxia sp. A1-2]